jgi:aminopeptidase-like protein
MERIDLFSSGIYKTKVNMDFENKSKLVEEIEQNYNIDPDRKTTGPGIPYTTFHSYYNDFGNNKFNKLNLDHLKIEYQKIFKNFFENIFPLDRNKPYRYEWELVNCQVGYEGEMSPHSHQAIRDDGYTCQFVSSHFLSFDDNFHNSTSFCNPTNINQFLDITSIQKKIDASNVKNSIYYENYHLNTEEDDMFIFPAYLRHYVKRRNNFSENKLRIIMVCNIMLDVSPTFGKKKI